jgi:hypothetical protein
VVPSAPRWYCIIWDFDSGLIIINIRTSVRRSEASMEQNPVAAMLGNRVDGRSGRGKDIQRITSPPRAAPLD